MTLGQPRLRVVRLLTSSQDWSPLMATSRLVPGTPVLRGRGTESPLLEGIIAAVRRGESRVQLLLGEAGIGKTALLEYLIQAASGLRVVRAAGVESEMELAYAALHQLCAPMLERAERLPGPKREALEIVFGLSEGPAPDRFLVGLGVLTLFSEAVEEGPMLCVRGGARRRQLRERLPRGRRGELGPERIDRASRANGKDRSGDQRHRSARQESPCDRNRFGRLGSRHDHEPF